VHESHPRSASTQVDVGGLETRPLAAEWDNGLVLFDEFVGPGDVEDDGPAPVLLGAEGDALRIRHDDVPEVLPPEAADAAELARWKRAPLGPEERRPGGLEVQGQSPTLEP
jgi:hypothetical protein